jgi:RIP metalloprotease RseP
MSAIEIVLFGAEVADDALGPDRPPPRPVRPLQSWIRLALVVTAVVALGVAFGWALLAIIGALVVSIILHELGHFLVAKRAGMKVTEFFLGFGPRLWSFRRGETEYGLKLIPAGAYVRILGMSNVEDVDPAEEARTYRSKSYPRRLSVVLAGPFANFLVAFVLMAATFVIWGQTSPESWEVGRVVAGSAAAQAGLQPGDRLVSVDGTPIGDWASLGEVIAGDGGATATVVYERDGAEQAAQVRLGWRLSPEIAGLLAPLRAGDQVLSVGGQEVGTYQDVRTALEASAGQAVEVVLTRPQGTALYEYRTEVVPPAELPERADQGFLGVSPTQQYERTAPVAALGEAVTTFGETTVESVRGLGSFLLPTGIGRHLERLTTATGDGAADRSPVAELQPVDPTAPAATAAVAEPDSDRLMSILGVLRLGSQAAESHPSALVWLVVVVNIGLGLINLLPLPPLDGGHAAVATYEAVRGRLRGRPYRVDMVRLMPIVYTTLFVLLGLGLSTAYLDVVNPAPNPFGP